MTKDHKKTNMVRDERKIESDITVYGATGYVGKYICQYLLDVADAESKPIKLTLAGRNRSKLEARKYQLDLRSSAIDFYVADSSEAAALQEMAERTRVVVCCSGPFQHYASNVVKACAETGADYVDITGEYFWTAKMRLQYGDAAKNSGARIISLCGFDSIPSDLSIFAAVEALRATRGATVQIEHGTTWHASTGGLNGGTVQSAFDFPINLWDMFLSKIGGKESLRQVPFFFDDPLVLADPTSVRHNPDYDDRKNKMAATEWLNQLPALESNTGYGFSAPFFMAVVNAKVVHASAVALGYGTSFTYRERLYPAGYKFTRMMGIFSIIPVMIYFVTMIFIGFVFGIPLIGKKLADKCFPPGTGPPDVFNQSCFTNVYAEVTAQAAAPTAGDRVDRATCYIGFQGDPGNLVTAQLVSESALALLWDRSSLPQSCGFGTPSELLGKVLLKRLGETKVRPIKITTTVRKDSPRKESQLFLNG
jgi:short subunit dehydrogenase-like uncharacterized protein